MCDDLSISHCSKIWQIGVTHIFDQPNKIFIDLKQWSNYLPKQLILVNSENAKSSKCENRKSKIGGNCVAG